MTKKIFQKMLMLSIGVLIVTLVCTLFVLNNYVTNLGKQELVYEARIVKAGVEDEGVKYLEEMPATDKRITLIDKDGDVVYDSSKNPEELENHKDREEIKLAKKEGSGFSKRFSKSISEITIYYAIKLDGGEILRLAVTKKTLSAMMQGIALGIIGIFGLMIVVSLWLSRKLSRKIVEPINSMNLTNPEDFPMYDELDPLVSRIVAQQKMIRQKEKEIASKENELDLIVQNLHEGLIIVDKGLRILSINENAVKLLSDNSNSHSVQVHDSILAVNRNLDFQDCIEKAISGSRQEIELANKDRVCYLIASPTFQHNGEVAGAVLIILDITERARGEHQRREFTANVSHELKTPLTSISGYAELMKSGLVKDEDMVNFSEKIYLESQKLIKLVEDILKLSKLDEASGIYKDEQVDMEWVIDQVIDTLNFAAQKKQVSVHRNHCPLILNANERVMTDVIYNLVDNAIKYNKDGGNVWITTFDNSSKKGFIVKDDGLGIAEAEQTRVFERFYREDKGRTSNIEGTGLGLAIVKNGVLSSGGKVSLKSEKNKGTEICVFWDKEQ